jgi:hypothetical protein
VDGSAYQNCTEHTDPGYFTITPRAAVTGLQLHDRVRRACTRLAVSLSH